MADVGNDDRRFLHCRPTGRLDYHVFKAAVNRYLWPQVGGVNRPVFLEIEKVCPALNEVTRSFAAIRSELDELLHDRQALPRYEEIDPGEGEIASRGRWSVFLLYLLSRHSCQGRLRCPQTLRVLDRVPHKTQAFFSILDPKTPVPLHEGPYLGYLRYHLALKVPPVRPPRLVIAGQEHVWREGEAALLDDTWPHEVINDSDEPRTILIVDIERPLRGLPAAVNRLAIGVARHTYGRAVMRRAQASGRRGAGSRRAGQH